MKPEEAAAVVRKQLEDLERWPTGMPFGRGVFDAETMQKELFDRFFAAQAELEAVMQEVANIFGETVEYTARVEPGGEG